VKAKRDLEKIGNVDREYVVEHYRRCEAFWRHWTPTIWSLPSVAAAINVGAYTLIFGVTKGSIDPRVRLGAIVILCFLNLALTIGVSRHRHMQMKFGDRIRLIEEGHFGIPWIKFDPIHEAFSGSGFYVLAMLAISAVSGVAFFVLLYRWSHLALILTAVAVFILFVLWWYLLWLHGRLRDLLRELIELLPFDLQRPNK
jgi:hypothetical protein